MIWMSDQWKDYEVLDTSNGERLERWGKYLLVRPDPQVIWNTPHMVPEWKKYDAGIFAPPPAAAIGLTIICRNPGRFITRIT